MEEELERSGVGIHEILEYMKEICKFFFLYLIVCSN